MRFALALLVALLAILPPSAYAQDVNRAPTSPTRSQATPVASRQDPLQDVPKRLSAASATVRASTAGGIVYDSGVVKVMLNGQNVYTAQTWAPCPAPLDMYYCPERLVFPDFWVAQLAAYEAFWVNCDPSSHGQAGMFCFQAYMWYASYLHPFIDRFPGTFVLKDPKPLPSCLDFPQIGYRCP